MRKEVKEFMAQSRETLRSGRCLFC